MTQVFNAYSSYYNLIYKDKDYVAEVEYVYQLIKKYKPGSKDIVEFGSGTGKHALLFSQKGLNVLGIEPSTEMLRIAAQNANDSLSFQNDSIGSFNGNNTYDVALALFHVISYVNLNEAVLQAFKNVHKHLNPGGLFIFDVWYSAAVLTQLPEKRTKTIENEAIKVIRNATPVNHWNRNIIDVIYDITVLEKGTGRTHNFLETHEMRHFSIPELDLLAKATGFEILKAEEFGTAKQPGTDTWGVCFVLRKV